MAADIMSRTIRGRRYFTVGQVLWPHGQLCNNLLHKFLIGPGCGDGPHILQISSRHACHFRERSAKVRGQAIDYLSAHPSARWRARMSFPMLQ
jgi:hypothetical protein